MTDPERDGGASDADREGGARDASVSDQGTADRSAYEYQGAPDKPIQPDPVGQAIAGLPVGAASAAAEGVPGAISHVAGEAIAHGLEAGAHAVSQFQGDKDWTHSDYEDWYGRSLPPESTEGFQGRPYPPDLPPADSPSGGSPRPAAPDAEPMSLDPAASYEPTSSAPGADHPSGGDRDSASASESQGDDAAGGYSGGDDDAVAGTSR